MISRPDPDTLPPISREQTIIENDESGKKPRRIRKSKKKYAKVFWNYLDLVHFPGATHINPYQDGENKLKDHIKKISREGEIITPFSIDESLILNGLEEEGRVVNIAGLAKELFKDARFLLDSVEIDVGYGKKAKEVRYDITDIKGFDNKILMARLSLPVMSKYWIENTPDHVKEIIRKELKKQHVERLYTLTILFPKSEDHDYRGLVIPLSRKNHLIPKKIRKEFGHIFYYVANDIVKPFYGAPHTDFRYYDVYFNKPSFERGVRDAINDLGSWGSKKND